MGCKTLYTEEWAERIVEWIADGKTLRAFLREHKGKEGLPAWRTVHDWVRNNEEFGKKYREARLLGFDAIAEEVLEISDTPLEGTIETMDGEKKITRKEDMLGHRKLQVETRLKLLAKWDPKRYGDAMKLTGDDTSPLIVKIVDPTRTDDEDGSQPTE